MTDHLTPTEHGDPADDPRAFRRALGQFATGVTVVTTSAGEQPLGMTVNSFSALSLDPALVLWSIRKDSRSAQTFTSGGHFAISVLSDEQVDVSGVFAHPDEDKFTKVAWTASAHGDPMVDGALAHFECTTEQVVEGGDHLILMGRVTRYATFKGAPLLFTQGRYGIADNHPGLPETSAPIVMDLPDEQDLLPTLVKRADRHLSVLFNKHRDRIGLNVASGRVLNLLVAGPRTFRELEQESLIGDHALEETLAALQADGSVHTGADSAWSLTEKGRQVRADLRRNAEEFTARQLRSIPDEDLAATERVLRRLAAATD